MDGFKIPKPRRESDDFRSHATSRPMRVEEPQASLQSVSENTPHDEPVLDKPAVVTGTSDNKLSTPTSPSKKPVFVMWLLALVGVLLLASVGAFIWYNAELRPLDPANKKEVDVIVLPQTSYSFAMQSLKQKGLIRSDLAATIYGYVSGKKDDLKEGTCRVTASQSTQQIVDILTKGCNEFRSITFFPGATIERPLYKPDHAQIDQTMNIKSVLGKAGYSDAAIASALSKQYEGPLFEGKPAGSSLEGYIYGDTYHVDPNATAEAVLQTAFDQMYKDVQKYDLKAKYSSKGLNLFQGITVASIVQRELNCEGKPTEERREKCYQYQRTIAQIFLKRLKEDIQLGSDVTFIYAADQMKVAPRVDLDSPYNTRKYGGLPPGPIASPGVHALRAVADPTPTDYVYFIAGDDGLIYFAKTEAQHEKNILDHCQKLCNEL